MLMSVKTRAKPRAGSDGVFINTYIYLYVNKLWAIYIYSSILGNVYSHIARIE